MEQVNMIGIDLAKNSVSCTVHGWTGRLRSARS